MRLDFGLPFGIGEVKATGNGDYEVAGYASTFGNVDLGYDVILPGAFDKTLREKALSRIKFLHSHLPWEVLGVTKELKIDDKGLLGRFKISKTRLGEDVHTLVLDGALDSFSIGYRTTDFEYTENGNVRQIKEVDLFEVSLVAMPMNPDAVVTAAKNYADNITLVEQLDRICAELDELLSKHGEITEAKQTALLATFAKMDALRARLQAPTPEPRADVRLQLEMAKRRSHLRELGII